MNQYEKLHREAELVIDHAKKRAKRGKQPSMSYKEIKNPRKALEEAKSELGMLEVKGLYEEMKEFLNPDRD